jgi:hypothetical protein
MTIRTKHRSAYAHPRRLRTITVEQPVDKPFMTAAAAGSVWLPGSCSFFNQLQAGKTGACSMALRGIGAREKDKMPADALLSALADWLRKRS